VALRALSVARSVSRNPANEPVLTQRAELPFMGTVRPRRLPVLTDCWDSQGDRPGVAGCVGGSFRIGRVSESAGEEVIGNGAFFRPRGRLTSVSKPFVPGSNNPFLGVEDGGWAAASPSGGPLRARDLDERRGRAALRPRRPGALGPTRMCPFRRARRASRRLSMAARAATASEILTAPSLKPVTPKRVA
jgi:hypothetical protein